jgi:hypothetical protein
MHLFALGHKTGMGKDTAFKIIKRRLEAHGYIVHRAAFADEVKNCASYVFGPWGLKPASYYEENYTERDVKLPGLGRTPREIWNLFGTNVAREIYANTWAERVASHIKGYSDAIPQTKIVFVVTDLRFPNEVEVLRAMSAVLVKVICENPSGTPAAADKSLESFTGWDYILQNPKTPEFEDFIIEMLETYKLACW